MKKTYRKPKLDVRIYALEYNSVFTDSGDRIDDDVYDITGNASGSDMNSNIFGD